MRRRRAPSISKRPAVVARKARGSLMLCGSASIRTRMNASWARSAACCEHPSFLRSQPQPAVVLAVHCREGLLTGAIARRGRNVMHAQKLLKWEILPIARKMPAKRYEGKGAPVCCFSGFHAGSCGEWASRGERTCCGDWACCGQWDCCGERACPTLGRRAAPKNAT